MPLKPIPTELKRGIAYPFRFTDTGNVQIAVEEDNLKCCIRRILDTRPGEDPFAYEIASSGGGIPFGTRVNQALFSDLASSRDILVFETKLALDTWEPRIVVLSIDFNVQKRPDGKGYTVGTIITYRIRSTGNIENYINVS